LRCTKIVVVIIIIVGKEVNFTQLRSELQTLDISTLRKVKVTYK